jgi:hypothetical protein
MTNLQLGRRVFKAVERAQGYAFVSDSIEEMPDARAAKFIRGSLKNARLVVRILSRYLREYEEEMRSVYPKHRAQTGTGGRTDE